MGHYYSITYMCNSNIYVCVNYKLNSRLKTIHRRNCLMRCSMSVDADCRCHTFWAHTRNLDVVDDYSGARNCLAAAQVDCTFAARRRSVQPNVPHIAHFNSRSLIQHSCKTKLKKIIHISNLFVIL